GETGQGARERAAIPAVEVPDSAVVREDARLAPTEQISGKHASNAGESRAYRRSVPARRPEGHVAGAADGVEKIGIAVTVEVVARDGPVPPRARGHRTADSRGRAGRNPGTAVLVSDGRGKKTAAGGAGALLHLGQPVPA